MSVPLALPGAVAYGIADFAGGLAARRSAVLVVTAVAQASGLVALLPLVGLVPGSPSLPALLLGAGAGIVGTTGLLLYLRALAVGPMGVVAPTSAVVSAGLPLAIGVVGGERPGLVTVLAIVVALAAIVLATAGTARSTGAVLGPLLGLVAGAGFGLFFIAIDAAPADSGVWPLLAGRVTSTVLLGVLLCARRGARGRPAAAIVRLMVLSGVTDTLANVLFQMSARGGDLGVTSVIVSLYPVVVVLLARIVLKERLTGMQLTGAGLALGASVLLATSG